MWFRFVPSEFGNEVDRARGLSLFEVVLKNKIIKRRAIEEAKILYTFVCTNSLTTYFIDYILHPRQKSNQIIVY